MRLNEFGDRIDGCREIRKLDHREKQGRNPEDVVVGEQREESEDRHDLNLDRAGTVRPSFGQGMELKVEIADRDHHRDQEDAHRDEQRVALAGRGDEPGQMVIGRERVDGVIHVLSVTSTDERSSHLRRNPASRHHAPLQERPPGTAEYRG